MLWFQVGRGPGRVLHLETPLGVVSWKGLSIGQSLGGWAGWGRAPGSPGPTSATSFLPGSGPAGSCLVALPQDDALGSVLQPLIQHGGRELRLQARPTGFESLLCHPLAGEYGVISHLTISVSSSLQWGNDSTYTYRVNSRIKCENAYNLQNNPRPRPGQNQTC